MRTFRRLLGFLAPYRRGVYWSFGLAFGAMGVTVLIPWLTGRAINAIRAGQRHELIVMAIAITLVTLVRLALSVFRRLSTGPVALAVESDLRKVLYRHLMQLELGFFDRQQTGQLMSRVTVDLMAVRYFLAYGLVLIGQSVFTILLAAIAMFAIKPDLAAVSLAPMPIVMLVAHRYRRRSRPAFQEFKQRLGELTADAEENISGVRVIKAFACEERQHKRFRVSATRVFDQAVHTNRLASTYTSAISFLPNLGLAAILLVGGHEVMGGSLNVGDFTAFYGYLLMLLSPVQTLGITLTFTQSATASGTRIFELLDRPPHVTEAPDASELPAGNGRVELVGAGVTYDGATRPALREASLVVEAGMTTALVGPMGSGKTTLVALLSRLYDVTTGSVLIDGADVRSVQLASLRRAIAHVDDDPFLFSASVHENIAYACPEASREEVAEAARRAQADGFIAQLPDGYETLIGERGLTLSGGQRQRIAVARAILANPRILVLDDATCSVDPSTEWEIKRALTEVMANRTTFIISHRPSMIAAAEQIVVLDRGRIVDTGASDQLLERCELYRNLIDAAVPPPMETRQRHDRARPRATARTMSADDGRHDARGERRDSGHVLAGRDTPAAIDTPKSRFPRRIADIPRHVVDVAGRIADIPRRIADIAGRGAELTRRLCSSRGRARKARCLLALLRPYRWPVIAMVVSLAAASGAALAPAPLAKLAIDQGIDRHDVGELNLIVVAFLGSALAYGIASYLSSYFVGWVGQRALRDLRLQIFEHLQSLSIGFYSRNRAGAIVSRLTNDVEALDQLISDGLAMWLQSSLRLMGVIVILLVLNPRLALLTFITLPVMAVGTFVFRLISADGYRSTRERIATITGYLQESLSGIRVVRSYGQESQHMTRFEDLNDQNRRANMFMVRLNAAYYPLVELLSGLVTVEILLIGGFEVLEGHTSTGVVFAFIAALNNFFGPIQQLSQLYTIYQSGMAALENIFVLLDEKPELEDAPDARELPRARGELCFEQVSLRYGPDVEHAAWALRDVNLRIAPGQTVAVVGSTGAGKSSLAKLASRFYDPTLGRVLVDGHDLREIAASSLRSQMGVVPQEAFLFSGTVRENIAFARPNASEADIVAAARTVGAHGFISALDHGYDTDVGERGVQLSAGQRQLIAFARALAADPRILILDEATSNVDAQTETVIEVALRRLLTGRTAIVIAHRLSTIRRADLIVVLEQGRIIEQGTHDELLDATGTYWQLYSDYLQQAA